MYKNGKFMRKISKAAYTMGVVFLIAGMLMSFVTQPVMAQEGTPPVEPPPAEEQPPVQITDVATDVVPEGPAGPEVVVEPTQPPPPAEPTCLDSEKVQQCADGSDAAEVTAEDGTISILCSNGAAPELVCPAVEPPSNPGEGDGNSEEVVTQPTPIPTEPEITDEPAATEVVPTEETTPVEVTETPAAPAEQTTVTCDGDVAPALTCADGTPAAEDGTCADLSTPAPVCPVQPAADLPAANNDLPAANCNPALITISHVCNNSGGYDFTITNGNSSDEQIKWKFDNGQYQSSWQTIKKGKTITVSTDQAGATTLYVMINASGSPVKSDSASEVCPTHCDNVTLSFSQDFKSFTYTAISNGPAISWYKVTFCDGSSIDKTNVSGNLKTFTGGPYSSEIQDVYTHGGMCYPEIHHECTPPPTMTVNLAVNCSVATVTVTDAPNNNVTYTLTGPGGLSLNGSATLSGGVFTINGLSGAAGSYSVSVSSGSQNATASSSLKQEDCNSSLSAKLTVDCSNAHISVTNTGNKLGGNTTYAWSFLAANSTNASGNKSFPNGTTSWDQAVDGTAGTYSFTVDSIAPVTASLAELDCHSSLSSQLSVNCTTATITVTNSGNLQGGNTSYNWSFNAANVTNSASGTKSFPKGITSWNQTVDGSAGSYTFDVDGASQATASLSYQQCHPVANIAAFTVGCDGNAHVSVTNTGNTVGGSSTVHVNLTGPSSTLFDGDVTLPYSNDFGTSNTSGQYTLTVNDGSGSNKVRNATFDNSTCFLGLGDCARFSDGGWAWDITATKLSNTPSQDYYLVQGGVDAAHLGSPASFPVTVPVNNPGTYDVAYGSAPRTLTGQSITVSVHDQFCSQYELPEPSVTAIPFETCSTQPAILDVACFDINVQQAYLDYYGQLTLTGGYTGDGGSGSFTFAPVTVAGTTHVCFDVSWPGIPPTTNKVTYSASITSPTDLLQSSSGYLTWSRSGQGECPTTQIVLGHDEPKCNAAGNGIVWSFHNTNAFDGTIVWSLDGGTQTGPLPIAAGVDMKFETAPLGSHKVNVTLNTDFGSISLEVPANITSCGKKEEKKPPEELYVPVGKPQALIPVTGADLNAEAAAGMGLLQKLMTNFGLVFLGIAMMLDGYSRKLLRK